MTVSSADKISPVRISVVSYLNSRPFYRGLQSQKFSVPVRIDSDIPSVCAGKIATYQADIGLVPVGALTEINDFRLISDYCIGSTGKVNSVLLLSDLPLAEIKSVLLDYQSRTSVLLLKILAKNFWKIEPQWLSTEEKFEKEISGATAGLVIGDRALMIKEHYKYVYDLSEAWFQYTSLPFVFACWVSNKEQDETFLKEFNEALSRGLLQIDEIARKETSFLPEEVIKNYLTKNIEFDLDEKKKKALEYFLKLCTDIK